MKKTFLPALAMIALAAASCMNSDPAGSEQNNTVDAAALSGETARNEDEKFLKEAADGGLFEERLGNFMMKNATSPTVKQLGELLFNDHSKANQELNDLARRKGIMLEMELSSKKQNEYDDLVKKKGAELDKACCTQMVNDHKKDIELFKDEAANGKDNEIKAWASAKVPVLEHHLSMAENAEKETREKN